MTKEIEEKKREIADLEREVLRAQEHVESLNTLYSGKCFSWTKQRGKKRTIEMARFFEFRLKPDLRTIVVDKERAHVSTGDGVYPAGFSHTLKSEYIWYEYDAIPLENASKTEAKVFKDFTLTVKSYLNLMMDRAMDIHQLEYKDEEAVMTEKELSIEIDLPHLVLSSRGMSLLSGSPFIYKNIFFISRNSLEYAKKAVRQALLETRLASEYFTESDWRYTNRVENELGDLLISLNSAVVS